jgi:3-methylfumaryl-CoA hydratase
MTSSDASDFKTDSVTETIQHQKEDCSLSSAQRVAALLDLDPDDWREGNALPRGWQFFLIGARTRRSSLRSDGFPGLGLSIPEMGLPRLLLGGRSVTYHQDIPIGARLNRFSHISNILKKITPSGPMAIALISHNLHIENNPTPALFEQQTYLLLPANGNSARVAEFAQPSIPDDEKIVVVTPDETMLFQYSALGFNSHKIHLDRDHAIRVEGFPDLVVNGGLVTLLLTEYLRRHFGITFSFIKVRHLSPLFCGRPISMSAKQEKQLWRLKAYDDQLNLAVEIEVTPNES